MKFSSFIKHCDIIHIGCTLSSIISLRVKFAHKIIILFFKIFYLFLDGVEGRERNISMWLPLKHHLLETWPATRAYTLTGIEPATLWFADTSQGFFYVFFLTILFIFRVGGEGERRETIRGCLLLAHTGDLACNPGMCPDWESNR